MSNVVTAPLSWLRPTAFLLACLAFGARASAQNFDGCGTVVPGVTCPKLFQPDAGGLYVLNTNMSPYNIGDHLHVIGMIDPNCITICQQGNGCINPTFVGPCTPATDLCYGDGSQGNCPCNNNGAATRGCENSGTTGGARLDASGTTSPDTVVLSSAGERPTSLTIFIQGPGALAVPLSFGDGLRCVGGTLKRLYVKNAVAGTATAPQGGDPSITQRSAALGDPLSAGVVRHYFTYYRDPSPTFCPAPQGSTFNAANAISITW